LKAIGSIFITFIAAGSVFSAQPATAPAVVSHATLVQRANADGVSRLYAQIAAESVGGMPVAQIIDRVEGHTILMNGLAKAEQVGGPRVVGDDFIQVQLQISGPRAAQLVLQAVSLKPETSPISADRLAFLLQDWNQRVFTSTGASLTPSADAAQFQAMSATTSTTAPATPRVADLKLEVTPAWVNDPIVGSATAERGTSALRTARAAERAARDAFRVKIETLVLTGETKLGDVSMADDAVRDVIDDAVEAAKIVGVDYRANGSVEVRIALDGRQLWQAILATR
jgi:hypothetical protein